MGTVRKTITLTDQQDNWVKAQINAGHYTNDSECIRDLIRREQERRAEIEAIHRIFRHGPPADLVTTLQRRGPQTGSLRASGRRS